MASEPATPHELTLRAERFSFTPNAVEVTEGETVRLTREAIDVPHGIVIADLGVSIVAQPGEEPAVVEFRTDTPGRFQFTCAVCCGIGHDRMTGVLTVVPASGPAPGAGPDRVRDLAVDLVEPDFTLATLQTTLRLPHRRFAFRLTHRFSRPLDGGELATRAASARQARQEVNRTAACATCPSVHGTSASVTARLLRSALRFQIPGTSTPTAVPAPTILMCLAQQRIRDRQHLYFIHQLVAQCSSPGSIY